MTHYLVTWTLILCTPATPAENKPDDYGLISPIVLPLLNIKCEESLKEKVFYSKDEALVFIDKKPNYFPYNFLNKIKDFKIEEINE